MSSYDCKICVIRGLRGYLLSEGTKRGASVTITRVRTAVKKKAIDLLLFIYGGGIERWWISLGLSTKTEAFLEATAMFLIGIVGGLIGGVVARWLGLKPGVDIRVMPRPPGGVYTLIIIMLIICILYYRQKVKSN